MPAIARSEFTLALNQVATERGLNRDVVLDTIKTAILAAYKKEHGEINLEELTVELNPDNGEAKILKDKTDITPAGFGRIAAQTAKQVILQKIREAEKQAILTDYSSRVGTITSGMVLRFDGPNIIVDIGRTQAVMPPSEQIRLERYHLNQRLTFFLSDIRATHKGNEIVVSRAHKGLVEGLFKREVPEIANKSVMIAAVAREAGARTKIAVYSVQPGVDPIGSCVGQKGIRVQTVIGELGGYERIDIVQFNENIAQFIASSLSPATDIEVVINEKDKSAQVFIAENQLSLAIGKDGQNVRLSAKLTGYKIDIKQKQDAKTKKADIIVVVDKTVKKKKTVRKKTKIKKEE